MLDNGVFWDVDKTIPLYVLKHSVSLYHAADQWKDFSIIIGLEDATENLEATVIPIRKTFQNGQLFILLPNGQVFDSTGKRVE